MEAQISQNLAQSHPDKKWESQDLNIETHYWDLHT